MRTRAAGLRGAKLRPARPFQGRNSKFKINCNLGPDSKPAAERRSLHERPAGREAAALRPKAAAGCSAPYGRNSRFKIRWSAGARLSLFPVRGAACGARMFGDELRASAGRRLRPAAPIRAQIQDSKLVATPMPDSSRQARSRAEEPARADLRDAKLQPSARGRLRAAAPLTGAIQDSRFKIRRSAGARLSLFPVRGATCGRRARLQGAASLRCREAAARCARSGANSGFKIQDLKLVATPNA